MLDYGRVIVILIVIFFQQAFLIRMLENAEKNSIWYLLLIDTDDIEFWPSMQQSTLGAEIVPGLMPSWFTAETPLFKVAQTSV